MCGQGFGIGVTEVTVGLWKAVMGSVRIEMYDMSGSVMEYCQDSYIAYTEEPQVDPLYEDNIGRRMARGGCLSDLGANCAVYTRFVAQEDTVNTFIGLRLAM